MLAAALFLTQALAPPVQAQTREYGTTYRPPGVSYMMRDSGPFTIIYQRGYDQMAKRAAAELHAEMADTDSLASGPAEGRAFQVPVVFNAFNDRSNGYVKPFPFRSEIELPSLQSPDLIGGFSTWTGVVGPHELVHAMHADAQAGFGVGRVLGWMGNDLERVVNLAAPAGWVEGVAVYRESRVLPGAGRLNAPRFTMRYRAAMESEDPWSLAQMLERPAFTQPFDRFYVGGAHAFTHLALRDGTPDAEAFEAATGFFNQFPFLGFGVALWTATGDRPGQIRDQLREEALRYQGAHRYNRPRPTVVASADGLNHRRPYWLSETDVVATVQGYNVRRGLYRIDVTTGERTRIATQAIAGGTGYTLSPDSSRVWTGRYVPDAFSAIQSRAEVQAVRLDDGERLPRTHRQRVFSPVEVSSGRLFAVRNDGQVSHVVERQANGSFKQRTFYQNVRILHMAARPATDDVAVLANVGGAHRIYRLVPGDGDEMALEPWFGLSNLRMYDVSWGPNGRYLLVSAARPDSRPRMLGDPPDESQTPNVYALDTETGRVTRQTDARYGAMEAALSPSGNTLAYIRYRHERFDLVTAPFQPDASPLPSYAVERGAEASGPQTQLQTDVPPVASVPWGAERPYRAARHLLPRILYPVLLSLDDVEEVEDLGASDASPVGIGLGLQGADPLETVAYGAEAWVQDGAPWAEAEVQYAGIAPRPTVSAFHRPTLLGAGARFEETGAGLGVFLPVTFASNVYQSVGRFRLDAEYRSTRLVRDNVADEPFVQRATLEPSMTIGYRLQQNQRDLIPNTGLLLSAVSTHDLWTDRGPADGGGPEQGVLGVLSGFVPALSRFNTGIQLSVGVAAQRQGTEFGLGNFLPRGNEEFTLRNGTFLRWKGEVIQPLRYVDDGAVLLPVYVQAVYAYGFGSTLTRASDVTARSPRVSSVGGGLGVRVRFFSIANLDLRAGIAYKLEDREAVLVYR